MNASLYGDVKEAPNIGYTRLLVVSRKMSESVTTATATVAQVGTELWSRSNAIMFLILLFAIIGTILSSMSVLSNLDNVQSNWANNRCNPLYMPFASYFGSNAKENFNFCMGNVFQAHSLPFLGSITAVFSQFTGLLSSIFDSISSLRNVIATLGGGINVIFQEFTDRITNFFFKLRMSAIHIKALFGRMYAILFSIMYMGMSGISGMTSFTNTTLFSFLDTFCFPGNTVLLRRVSGGMERVPIQDICIGDMLYPGSATVTATFRFYAKGQPMVQLGNVVVSTNHYVMHQGHPIKAGEHPNAIAWGTWDKEEPLYCLNTTTNQIPVEYLTFMDYDETAKGDKETMIFIENRLNGTTRADASYPFTEYGFGIEPSVRIKTARGLVAAKDIVIGEKLSTGGEVVGMIRKQAHEVCQLSDKILTPSTLYWNGATWVRYGTIHPVTPCTMEMVSFVVIPDSQLELEDGTRVRDYMELCSPDAELHYTRYLESLNSL